MEAALAHRPTLSLLMKVSWPDCEGPQPWTLQSWRGITVREGDGCSCAHDLQPRTPPPLDTAGDRVRS